MGYSKKEIKTKFVADDEAIEGAEAKGDILEAKPSRSRVALLVGGVAGVVASTAAGWFLKPYIPEMDSKLKGMVMKAGIGLITGSVGSFVANDIYVSVDDTIDTVKMVGNELKAVTEACKKPKSIEIA